MCTISDFLTIIKQVVFMEVLKLQNLLKKDIPLHYRNEYSGDFILQTISGREDTISADFILERNAIGEIDISLQLKNTPDYPLLPVLNTLKEYIRNLDKTGKLP